MKLGVSSYSFAAYMKATGCDYLAICDIAKEIGYDAIEFIDLEPEVCGTDDLFAAARAIREHCEKIGLFIAAYTISADFLGRDGQEEVERVKGCVDIAAELGVPVMRHDACWKPASTKPGYTYRDAIAVIAPYIRQVAEYAQEKGIRTCTENHGFFIQDPNRVEELIRTVGHPNYGWLVDMGNFMVVDADILSAVATAAPYAFHVHAKDFLFKPGGSFDPGTGWIKSRGGNFIRGTIAGHGVVPVPQCIEMLKKAGYEGCFSLEFEGLEDNLTAIKLGYEFLRKYV